MEEPFLFCFVFLIQRQNPIRQLFGFCCIDLRLRGHDDIAPAVRCRETRHSADDGLWRKGCFVRLVNAAVLNLLDNFGLGILVLTVFFGYVNIGRAYSLGLYFMAGKTVFSFRKFLRVGIR